MKKYRQITDAVEAIQIQPSTNIFGLLDMDIVDIQHRIEYIEDPYYTYRSERHSTNIVFNSGRSKKEIEVSFGDWIVKDKDGHYAAYTDGMFRALYEEVSETPTIPAHKPITITTETSGYIGNIPFKNTFSHTI